jgi:hypothetical protein
MPPFSREQFLGVFASYHAEWPHAVWFFYAGAVCVLASIGLAPRRTAFRIGTLYLGVAWSWIAVAYHWLHFRQVNPAAGIFAGIFLLQGSFFLKQAIHPGKDDFKRPGGLPRFLGGLFALYSLVIYPVLGRLNGHGFPNGPSFELPCPTAIFTFAVLLLTVSDLRLMLRLAAIPLVWAFIGTSAASMLGIAEDWALLPSGLLSVTAVLWEGSRRSRADR